MAPRSEPQASSATELRDGPSRHGQRPRSASNRGKLVPPLLLMTLAGVILLYRVSVSDWHWPTAPTPESEDQTEPQATTEGSLPSLGELGEQTVAEVVRRGLDGQDRDRLARETRDEIEREAERIRSEREALEKLKQREGERLAELPPRPRPPRHRGLDPAAIARHQQQLRAARRAMIEQLRQMEAAQQAMMDQFFREQAEAFAALRRQQEARRFRPMPPPRPDFGRGFGAGDDFMARQFEAFARQQQEFLRRFEQEMQRGFPGPNGPFDLPDGFPAPPGPIGPPPGWDRLTFVMPAGRMADPQPHGEFPSRGGH